MIWAIAITLYMIIVAYIAYIIIALGFTIKIIIGGIKEMSHSCKISKHLGYIQADAWPVVCSAWVVTVFSLWILYNTSQTVECACK